ncbi:hypothetical protein vBEcoMWL3_gp054 [Escherichia phage vB_EcoM_WL-3]|nr:hypothetical protein vBEcoMWL3_gp054 [Escherichia phage vB_EcoM_WL-3]
MLDEFYFGFVDLIQNARVLAEYLLHQHYNSQ